MKGDFIMRVYSNEIVFRGHPDKVCDQIADALLDAYMKDDKNTRAGIECTGGKGVIFVTGEVTSKSNVDVSAVVHRVLRDVGYSDNFEVINNLGVQSPDIAQGVDIGGAGDQGMMFGYACNETEKYVPKAMAILQELSRVYDVLRKDYPNDFYADGKAQITGYYDDDFRLVKVKTSTISYQNSEKNREFTDEKIRYYAESICKNYNVEVEEFLINPTGKFLIGGFDGDAGVQGRKIVVDSYQSFAPVGGGSFSGKDPTKVDRSGAYKARQLAIRVLKRENLKWCSVQLSYAIGKAEPLAIYIDSDKGFIEPDAEWYTECTPRNMIEELKLKEISYEKTARFGHFGFDFNWEK